LTQSGAMWSICVIVVMFCGYGLGIVMFIGEDNGRDEGWG